jgi:16S rRNA (cytidine1402-2'-O)-methyltransferase
VPALVCSGLPSDRFSFEGFLPVKKGRTKRLKELSNEKKTMIFYESPHRILKTLTDFSNYFNDESLISVSRELTKLFEETFRGTIKESIEHFEKNKPKGEFVIVLSPK